MSSATTVAALAPPSEWRDFLVFFVHRHFNFRYAELDAVLTLQGLSFADVVASSVGGGDQQLPEPESSPVLRIRLPSNAHAKFLSSRAILIKGVYEVWGHAEHSNGDYAPLVKSVESYSSSNKTRIVADDTCSWCINVDAFGRKLNMEEQEARRQPFEDVLPFAGPVSVKNPQEKFLVLEEYALELPDLKSAVPRQMFFLHEIAGSERNRGRGGARDLIDQQTLKKRAYIGPTSMESEMALLMANMGLVTSGDLVIDPFVGTGSVLVPCATHGAVCFGTDIDIRVLLGIGVGVSGAGAEALLEQELSSNAGATRVNVVSNFRQYGLPLPELVRGDNSTSPLVKRCAGFFDAVVCDPPYGIRAGARKSGRRPGPMATLTSEQLAQKAKEKQQYIPPTQPYAAEDVMRDLLEFAAQTLRVGGRLVYLLPTTYEYTDADLPRHAMLRVIHNSEQKLTKKYARRLITMVKLSEPQCEREMTSGGSSTATTTSSAGTTSTSTTTTTTSTGSQRDDWSYANLREKILAENRKRKVTELLN